MRTERWKYIHYPDNPAWDELYDLRADPHELRNRIGDESVGGGLKELKAELAKLLLETGAKCVFSTRPRRPEGLASLSSHLTRNPQFGQTESAVYRTGSVVYTSHLSLGCGHASTTVHEAPA